MNNTTANASNESSTAENSVDHAYIHFTIAALICIVICLIGLVGNVTVFLYLCMKIKKNKYTIYIINLSVADFIYLVFSALTLMVYINSLLNQKTDFPGKESFLTFLEIFYDCAQYSGMFILTAISLERCLSVLFPIWYQCHRPRNLSIIICASAWLIGCSEGLIENLVCTQEAFKRKTTECTAVQIMTFGLSIVICLPIMVISSFILLINIRRTFSDQYPMRLYIIIIVAVVIFISSVIPFNVTWFLMYFRLLPSEDHILAIYFASIYSTVLNCALDPYIYFLIGKKWKQKTSQTIQDALEEAFRIENHKNNNSKSNKTSGTATASQIHLPSTS
ncbi:mas-related G-protein coupled receptor member H-like [Bufo bufo]|uniref:mas-related G-protein coupled receptor member H-like n=1 Tax=Bufo bufo TaxID=8384 RepID=UPI001ABEA26A|nr:mas-related G-protein coupled receptor member H-like [Bufo bufo]